MRKVELKVMEKKSYMDKKEVYVFYISVDGLDMDDWSQHVGKISDYVMEQNPTVGKGSIFIPVMGESKVECINPVYIKDEELIKKNERLMSELNEHLVNQLHQYENNKK